MGISEIFQDIIKCFHQKKDIEDEMFFYILDNISTQFAESHDDLNWLSHDQLLNRLDKVWQYKQFDGLDVEQSYLYGGIWGCLKMLSCIQQKKSVSQKCYTIASKYETGSAYTFLNSIYDNPGLHNKRLAQICNVSSARISQIASEALKDGLICAQSSGKEKIYYIRTMGETVHNIVKKRKDELTKQMASPDYKMIIFSNDENDFLKKCMRLNAALNHLNQHNKVAVAIAYHDKQTELASINKYELKRGKEQILWNHEMNNYQMRYSNKSFIDFWKEQKEATITNQL